MDLLLFCLHEGSGPEDEAGLLKRAGEAKRVLMMSLNC